MAATLADLLNAAELDAAIELQNGVVRQRPAEAAPRILLAELLCFAGNLERADRLLDAASHQDTASAIGVALFRQLIRAEEARQQFYAEGRLPAFLETPTAHDKLYLQAIAALRAGDGGEASALLEEAEGARPALPGTADGTPFNDFRDLDDVSASHLDVLTTTGKFYWVPLRDVIEIELHKPERRRDLLWRRATLSIERGPDGEVYLPAIYPFSSPPSAALRLGHETAFEGGDGTPVRGVGQRSFLIDDEAMTLMELGRIRLGAGNR